MTRTVNFLVTTWALAMGSLVSAQDCSLISGSCTVSGGYQCGSTDPPFQSAWTTWSVTGTCLQATCGSQIPVSQYDSPSDTLDGNGQCGKYNTSTDSSIPGAVNCYPFIYGTLTDNDVGGENLYTAQEEDQTQSSDVQSCLNSGSWTSEVDVECDYQDCPICGEGGYCSSNDYCDSGCCISGTCQPNNNCNSGGGGGNCPGGNGCSCSADGDCDSGNCEGSECEDLDPIIIDVTGHGYQLTSVNSGVQFDFYGNGTRIQMSWTASGWEGGFLALDRNGNGRIDNATELFSNITPQPTPTAGKGRNGFLALAVYDEPANGGNGDGWIDAKDAIYSKLLVWVDTNHNGISEPGELLTLQQAGIQAISLSYSPSQWADAFGNIFRYSSQLRTNTSPNQVVYDVLLQKAGTIKTGQTTATKQ